MQVQGVCNHHDLGPLGAALQLARLERQLEILKEMGCNAIRTSHNPPAPELLDLADRMGFLVMDEAFDCWQQGKTAGDYSRLFDAWHARDLRAMVRRDRNHPSVIMWSIGNEISEQNGPRRLAKQLARHRARRGPHPPRHRGLQQRRRRHQRLPERGRRLRPQLQPEAYTRSSWTIPATSRSRSTPPSPRRASARAASTSSPSSDDKDSQVDFQVSLLRR